MNANELADKRHECQTFSELLIWGMDAEEMLRQQQEKLTKYKLRHAEQRKRIEELEAKTQDEGYEVVFDGEKYTTKLKEPEKMLSISRNEALDVWDKEFGRRPITTDYIPAFARAILRKAQEK